MRNMNAAFILIDSSKEFDDFMDMTIPCRSSWSSSIGGVRYEFIDIGSDGLGSKPTRIRFSVRNLCVNLIMRIS